MDRTKRVGGPSLLPSGRWLEEPTRDPLGEMTNRVLVPLRGSARRACAVSGNGRRDLETRGARGGRDGTGGRGDPPPVRPVPRWMDRPLNLRPSKTFRPASSRVRESIGSSDSPAGVPQDRPRILGLLFSISRSTERVIPLWRCGKLFCPATPSTSCSRRICTP